MAIQEAAMPRFFFDIHDGIEYRDEDGMDLPAACDARGQAMHLAAAYAAKPEMLSEDGGSIVVTVRSDEITVVLAIRLAFSISPN